MKIVQKFKAEINGVHVYNQVVYNMVEDLVCFANHQRMILNEEMALDIYKFSTENLNISDYDEYLRYIKEYSMHCGCIRLFHEWLEEDYFDEINERLENLAKHK